MYSNLDKNITGAARRVGTIYGLTERSIGKRGHGRRTTNAGHRTNDGKDGQTMEKTDKQWKRRTNDGKDGQTMEKTDKRWRRRKNDGKDGQTYIFSILLRISPKLWCQMENSTTPTNVYDLPTYSARS